MSDSGDDYKPPVKRTKRKYVKRESNTTVDVNDIPLPSPAIQIPNVAFNIHGWGLEDGMTGRGTYEVINANKATMIKGGFESKIRELQAKGVHNIYRQQHRYTAREKDTKLPRQDSNVVQYLVVGYTLQEYDPLFVRDKTFFRHSEGEIIGEDMPQPQHLLRWSACLPPILVVTPVKQNTGTSVRLFALILPRNGLCQPVLITQERIFYRWEFRASSGTRPTARNKAWNEVVVRMALEKMPNRSASTEEHTTKRAKLNTSTPIKPESKDETLVTSLFKALDDYVCELHVDLDAIFRSTNNETQDSLCTTTRLRVTLTPEINSILEAVKATKSDRIVSDLQNALNDAVRVNGHPLRFSGLSAFVSQGPFGSIEAEATVRDIQELWSNLVPYARPDTIRLMWSVMKQNDIVVGLLDLHDLFNGILPMMNSRPMKDDDIADHIRLVVPQHGTFGPNAGLSSSLPRVAPDTVMLVQLMTTMMHIRKSEQRFAMTLAQDTDSVKLTPGQEMVYDLNMDYLGAQHSFRGNVEQLIVSARDHNSPISDIAIWFKTLRAIIQRS